VEEKLKHADITDKILKAFFTKVYRHFNVIKISVA